MICKPKSEDGGKTESGAGKEEKQIGGDTLLSGAEFLKEAQVVVRLRGGSPCLVSAGSSLCLSPLVSVQPSMLSGSAT